MSQAENTSPAAPETDLSLEREKIQIERERLALERERWETERESYRHTVSLTNRAAGRVVVPVSTFALAMLCALLLGGAIGAWIVASRFRANSSEFAATLAEALGPDALGGTNGLDSASAQSPLFRALNHKGHRGGVVFILD